MGTQWLGPCTQPWSSGTAELRSGARLSWRGEGWNKEGFDGIWGGKSEAKPALPQQHV